MYKLLLTLHILAAGTWIGANVVQLVTNNRMTAKGGSDAASWHQTVAWWGRVIYSPAAVVLLATGIGLVIDVGYDWGSTFISIGFVAIIGGAAIGITKLAKGSERAAAAFSAGDDAAGQAEIHKNRPWQAIDMALLLLAVVAMVYAWGASFS